MPPVLWSGTCARHFTICSHVWAMHGLRVGGRRRRIDGDMNLGSSWTLRWAVAVLEIVSEPPELVLEMLLAKEEGPAVITQPGSAGTASSHDQVDLD